MDNSSEPLVLRTVYLNSRYDERIRHLASERKISKGELIRQIIEYAIPQIEAKRLFVKPCDMILTKDDKTIQVAYLNDGKLEFRDHPDQETAKAEFKEALNKAMERFQKDKEILREQRLRAEERAKRIDRIIDVADRMIENLPSLLKDVIEEPKETDPWEPGRPLKSCPYVRASMSGWDPDGIHWTRPGICFHLDRNLPCTGKEDLDLPEGF